MNTLIPSRPITPCAGVRRGRLGGGGWRTVMLGLVLLVAASSAPAKGISKEHQLKAAFLFNFTKFVEWPADRFETTDSPIVIAVLGRNPFDGELHKLVEGRSVNGRFIHVRLIEGADEIPHAHVVYVAAGEETRLNNSIFGEPGVLTVGESAVFAERGGVIRFTLIDGKVRFEINQASGDQAGLKLSGQLLKLATVVRKTP